MEYLTHTIQRAMSVGSLAEEEPTKAVVQEPTSSGTEEEPSAVDDGPSSPDRDTDMNDDDDPSSESSSSSSGKKKNDESRRETEKQDTTTPEETTTTTTSSSSSGKDDKKAPGAANPSSEVANTKQNSVTTDPRARARQMLLKAIAKNPSALATAPREVQKNESFLLSAIESNATVLEYVPPELRDSKHFVLKAVAVNGRAIWHAPMFLQKDHDIIIACVAKHGADYMRDTRDDGAQPAMDYYLRVMRSSRSAVAEIRNELEHAADEAAEAFSKREMVLKNEIASLNEKTQCLEAKTQRLEAQLSRRPSVDTKNAVDVSLVTASVEPALKKLRLNNNNTTCTAKNKDSDDVWDEAMGESYCQSALHLHVLQANNLKAKVDELAAMARAAGADAKAVDAVVNKSTLKVTA